MNSLLKHLTTLAALGALFATSAVFAPSAVAQTDDNAKYGPTRLADLPDRGVISKKIWVGSWWAYVRDGLAHRWDAGVDASDATKWTAEKTEATDPTLLSPIEKYDAVMKRDDKIEYDAMAEYLGKHYEIASDITEKIEERRGLIYKLNAWLAENPGGDWREEEDGKRYLELTEEIDTAKEGNEPTFEVDTATEFEILEHGTGQFGNESWFGHCNAWAATAIVDEEPLHPVTIDGVTFSPADMKGLLTEVWMEMRSSFYGTRSEYNPAYDDSSKAREAVSFQDVTPAAFHIFFSDQVANKDRSFVIDRYTGSEVWNQPVKAFRVLSKEAMYTAATTDDAGNDVAAEGVETDVKITRYGWQGDGRVESLGTQTVYPVAFTTTIHWVTDGLPHDVQTLDYPAEVDDSTFSSSWRFGDMTDHQIEQRTLSYVLWLDKPMEDPEARIVGDGEWNHEQISGSAHLQPDFMWQPLSNSASVRRYENPYVDYDYIANTLLPESLKTPGEDDTPAPAGTFVSEDVPLAIPDNDLTGITSRLTIDGETPITSLAVQVTITHTYIGDLGISLTGPDGRTVEVKARGEGGSSDDLERTVDLHDWDGGDAAGSWMLKVFDGASIDTGELVSWSLIVN